jgi:hypothetical protein
MPAGMRRAWMVALLIALGSCTGPDENLRWFYTCGDPVCRGVQPHPELAACTTQRADDPCSPEGQQCDPRDVCNRLLVCAAKDPRSNPGGCPLSSTSASGTAPLALACLSR